MSTTIDLRIYSKQLLQALQQLDTLLDRVAAADPSADELKDLASQSLAIFEALTATREGVQSAAKNGLEAKLDPAEARRATALSIAEFPLEPAIEALRAVPRLVEKANAQQAGHAMIAVPLCLAYSHCVEALRPLAAAVEPRDLVKER